MLADCSDRLEHVEHLFVEYHGTVGNSRAGELFDLLAASQFDVFVEQEHAIAARPFRSRSETLGLDVQLNLYCVRSLRGGT